MPHTLPPHLKRYVVKQDYSRYNEQDQAVWRYIMRQLKHYLSKHAHEVYVEGLAKTGLSSDAIPKIEVMSRKLRRFGWSAIPVSGFIPPAAFMEFQARGFLPIASEMRTLEHIHYTPAPDIVHEAAGHAPIIVDPNFSAYLKRYADVAAKAIISHEDMALYEAIRDLSDAKENPRTTPERLRALDERLQKVGASMTFVSEAAILGRMNWWTAEYGLIGNMKKPKIFGAGLLSSLGEARECLDPKVEKLPLTLKCIDYSYDITEPQPQLFVTPNFQNLCDVLDELAQTMAFKRGGPYGLDVAIQAKTVNTVELNSGVQVSGTVASYLKDEEGQPIFVRFSGPTQICYENKELPGQGKSYHKQGFSTPIGPLQGHLLCLSEMTPEQLDYLGFHKGKISKFTFSSGIQVEGKVHRLTFSGSKLLVATFKNCTVRRGDTILFQPEWGLFDMAVGSSVPSVFGGPADRAAYGTLDQFKPKRVPKRRYSANEKKKFLFFKTIRVLRARKRWTKADRTKFLKLVEAFKKHWPTHWLLGLELLELSYQAKQPAATTQDLLGFLRNLKPQSERARTCLEDGIKIADQKL